MDNPQVYSREDVIIAEIKRDLLYIKEKINDIELKLDHQYVTQAEFQPVRMIAYGLVSMVVMGVVGALLLVVLR